MLLGKLDKMKLVAYGDDKFSNKIGEFKVTVNPESYTINYSIEHSEEQGQGTIAPAKHFNKIPAQTVHFDFVFDSSGVLVEPSLLQGGLINPFSQTENIVDQLEQFRNFLFTYQSETHQPNFVAINWGTLLFKGKLTNLDIEYKLFKPDGTPIRAIAKADFEGFIEENLRVALANPLSPDITHQRLFGKDDRLDLLVNKMYQDDRYYIDVARRNGLNSFRNIQTGTKLLFPPVEK